jgi:hypothetical protein
MPLLKAQLILLKNSSYLSSYESALKILQIFHHTLLQILGKMVLPTFQEV